MAKDRMINAEQKDSLDLNCEELVRIRELFEEKQLLSAYELLNKNKMISMTLSFLCAPIGYAYIKKYDFMLISLFTLNYFFLGFIIGPLHLYQLYNQAEERLKNA